MSWKKNVFSYLLWVLYAVAAEVGLVCLADAVCDSLGAEIYIGTIACAFYVVLAGAGVFLIHRFAPKYSETEGKNHSLWTVISAATAVILLAIGFVLRVQGAGGAEGTSVYYELAAVGPERELSEGVHGAVYFYIQMLHGLLYFLGNKPAVAVWAQILLQMGALLLFYLAVKRLTGRIAALVTLAFCMFSSYLIREASRLSPAMLYLFFWSAVLLVIMSVVRAEKQWWGFPVAGLLIAVQCYLDVAGFLLLLIFITLIFGEENKTGRRGKRLLLCLAGAGAGFTGCALADSLVNGKTFPQMFAVWGELYRPGEFRLPVTTDTPEILVEYIVLFCVLTTGMYSFWRDRRRDRRKGWLLLLFLLGAAGCFRVFTEEMPMGIYMYLLLAVLAGIAVEECVCLVQQVPAEESIVLEKAEAGEQFGGEALQMTAARELTAKNKTAENKMETGGVQKMTEKGAETEGAQQGEIHFIENPLPLPKKHVKRRLDYGMEVPEGKYDFDLDVDEKDDFDI